MILFFNEISKENSEQGFYLQVWKETELRKIKNCWIFFLGSILNIWQKNFM